MTAQAKLRIEGGQLELGRDGLVLEPWFTKRTINIPWTNVMCVSPVPSVKHSSQGWKTFRGETIDPVALRSRLRFYCFEIALHCRDQPLSGVNMLMRMWLRATVWLKPLYVEEDVPHPHYGCIKLYFPKRWVRANGEALISALEIIEAHSNFDLLTTID